MDFKYYQYKLGTAYCHHLDMHASLFEVVLDPELSTTENAFLAQMRDFLTGAKQMPMLLQRHLKRGINLSDSNNTTVLIASVEFPLQSMEPGFYNTVYLEYALVGGDTCTYEPDLLVEDYYYFGETAHPLSQWHQCRFSVEGITFSSAEQYMMYQKALLFNDAEIAKKILATSNVREQKQLGRMVRNFEVETWNQRALDIVYRGNQKKFEQNPELKKLLLSTSGKTIVEASPTDSIWGIGLSAAQPESANLMAWRGTNWLGIALTELREDLLGNQSDSGYLTLEEFKSKMKPKRA